MSVENPSPASPATTEDQRVANLINEAVGLSRVGRHDEAMRTWARILTIDGENPDALYHVGNEMLRTGKINDAEVLFKRALVRAEGAPLVHLALAQTANALGKTDQELAALDRVLTLDPYSVTALLAKGAVYERLGKPRTAGAIYKNAFKCISPTAEIPMQARQMLERAASLVKAHEAGLDAYISEAVAPLRVTYSSDELARYDECQKVFAGLKPRYVQQPLLLSFPQLPAIQFYDRSLFPWIARFEAHYADIKAELEGHIAEQRLNWEPYISHPDGSPLNQWKDLQRSTRWSSYFLWKDGRCIEDALASFPRTSAALADVPLGVAPGRGPTVFFSSLAPKTRIPAHTGSTNARLVLHLPLIVPSGCGLRVGNDSRSFAEGRAWVFDDTIEHEAWNDSEHERIILLIDIWNPFLSEIERTLVAELLSANERYYSDEA